MPCSTNSCRCGKGWISKDKTCRKEPTDCPNRGCSTSSSTPTTTAPATSSSSSSSCKKSCKCGNGWINPSKTCHKSPTNCPLTGCGITSSTIPDVPKDKCSVNSCKCGNGRISRDRYCHKEDTDCPLRKTCASSASGSGTTNTTNTGGMEDVMEDGVDGDPMFPKSYRFVTPDNNGGASMYAPSTAFAF
mgnify:CR=1 FL=1